MTMTPAALRLARIDLTRLPRVSLAAEQGNHSLLMISEDWYVLVGPDDPAEDDMAWPLAHLPGELALWSATFETFGDVLATHFTR